MTAVIGITKLGLGKRMTKKLYYEKRGRRYVPVAEHDYELHDAMPKGNHLIMCYPGGQSTRYNIDPALAPMIAAGRVAEDRMSEAVRKASEMRPRQTPLTEGQRRAWRKLAKEFGDELATLNCASARDIAEAGLKAMQEEADKLLTNPTVRKAYERFLFVAELSKETHNVSYDL
jgi:hypothetical protein